MYKSGVDMALDSRDSGWIDWEGSNANFYGIDLSGDHVDDEPAYDPGLLAFTDQIADIHGADAAYALLDAYDRMGSAALSPGMLETLLGTNTSTPVVEMTSTPPGPEAFLVPETLRHINTGQLVLELSLAPPPGITN